MKPPNVTRHHRHLLELASLLTTAGLADVFADLFGRRSHGADALVAIGFALTVCTAGHHLWLRRTNHAPPGAAAPVARPLPSPIRTTPSRCASAEATPGPNDAGAFWRLRTRIDNTPGRLAVLAGALAAAGANIHALEAYPTADGVVDEFLIEASQATTSEHLCGAVRAVGGHDIRAVPTDVLALLDGPTRALELAIHLARRPGDFDAVLAGLLDARSVIVTGLAGATSEPDAPTRLIDETTFVLRRADGRAFTVSRPELPFTGTELSRACTLADLADRLHSSARAQAVHPSHE